MAMGCKVPVFLTVLLIGVVGATFPIVPLPISTPVITIPVTLDKVLQFSPYYTIAISSQTNLGINTSTIDSVCYSLTNPCVSDSSLSFQATTTLTCGSTIVTPAVLTQVQWGDFYVNASTFSFEDYHFFEPCPNTYVLYRCSLSGNSSDTGLVILSSNRNVDPVCLSAAESFALKIFPNTVFTCLPNSAPNPCGCIPACGG